MSKVDIAFSALGVVVELVQFIAKSLGKTTAEVLADVQADCDKRAKDPSDETDAARKVIDADLPSDA